MRRIISWRCWSRRELPVSASSESVVAAGAPLAFALLAATRISGSLADLQLFHAHALRLPGRF